jgi:hypothetical protein
VTAGAIPAATILCAATGALVLGAALDCSAASGTLRRALASEEPAPAPARLAPAAPAAADPQPAMARGMAGTR